METALSTMERMATWERMEMDEKKRKIDIKGMDEDGNECYHNGVDRKWRRMMGSGVEM